MPETKQIELPDMAERVIKLLPAKVREIEAAYVETVTGLEALLESYYNDVDVRRTIAECSDPARELYRQLLVARNAVQSDPDCLAHLLISERAWEKASESRTEGPTLQSPIDGPSAPEDDFATGSRRFATGSGKQASLNTQPQKGES